MAVTQGRQDYTGQQLAAGIMQNALAQQTETYNQRRKALTDFVDNQLKEGYHITSIARLNPGLMEELSTYDPGFKNFITDFKDAAPLMTESQRTLEIARLLKQKQEGLPLPMDNVGSASQPTTVTQTTNQPAGKTVYGIIGQGPSWEKTEKTGGGTVTIPGKTENLTADMGIQAPGMGPGTSGAGLDKRSNTTAQGQMQLTRTIEPERKITLPPEQTTTVNATPLYNSLVGALRNVNDPKERQKMVDNFYKLSKTDYLREDALVKELTPLLANPNINGDFNKLPPEVQKKYWPSLERLRLIDERQTFTPRLQAALNPVKTVTTTTTPTNAGGPSTTTQPSTGTTGGGETSIDRMRQNKEQRQYEIDQGILPSSYRGSINSIQRAVDNINTNPEAAQDFYENTTFERKRKMRDMVVQEALKELEIEKFGETKKQNEIINALRKGELDVAQQNLGLEALKLYAKQKFLDEKTGGMEPQDLASLMSSYEKGYDAAFKLWSSKDASEDVKKAELDKMLAYSTSMSALTQTKGGQEFVDRGWWDGGKVGAYEAFVRDLIKQAPSANSVNAPKTPGVTSAGKAMAEEMKQPRR